MTYIEFFDQLSVENLCACLTNVPERVILIGNNAKKMRKYIVHYEKIFAERGHHIEFVVKTVSKGNLSQAIAVLSEIIETYPDCAFGITGGDEMLLFALGCVYERYKDRHLQIHRFNVRNNTVYDCDADGKTIYKETPLLSVCDNVRLYGGDIVYSDVDGDGTYLWDMTPDFVADIDAMWAICRKNVRRWNARIGVLEEVERIGQRSEDGLSSALDHDDLNRYLAFHKIGANAVRKFLDQLKGNKLLTDWTWDDQQLQVAYKNLQVKRCLTKAGQVLEMKIYSLIDALKEPDGSSVYDDVRNGVVIAWEDIVNEDTVAVRNEIDIMMTYDLIPVFVSCKNGYIKIDELYKLDTVATKFGGAYAKKVLIATALDSLGSSADYFRQRAEMMNIKIIEDVQTLSDEQLAKKLKNLWRA